MMKEDFIKIKGIKTKGGFPVIELEDKFLIEDLETSYKFYDSRIDTYFAFKDGFFYSWNDGQTCLSDYEIKEKHIRKGMKIMHKELMPRSKLSFEDMNRIRNIGSSKPRRRYF